MERWQRLLQQSIITPSKLAQLFKLTEVEITQIKRVISTYPMRINPYYLSLIKEKGDPIWKQAVPDISELNDAYGLDDPLCEEEQSPVPNLTHRYPDRVLFLVSNRCAMYCRFCTRKRKVGRKFVVNKETIQKGLEYIKRHTEIRDVLLSGGDPLLLTDAELEPILNALRKIRHVEIIRIGTRVPCTLPHRITGKLCQMLKRYHPLYVNTHFNHPAEITKQSAQACERLVNAGIPVGCQTVLLKGVNDDVATMKTLMQKLVKIRVKPYYLYQTDLTRGTFHFRTQVEKGLEIVKGLRGFTSGLCVPHYIIDAPGGGGKIPLLPDYFIKKDEKGWWLKNYKGQTFIYPNPGYEHLVNDNKETDPWVNL